MVFLSTVAERCLKDRGALNLNATKNDLRYELIKIPIRSIHRRLTMNSKPIRNGGLRCPVTKVPLKPLDAEHLKCLNRMITAGRARHVDGTTVSPIMQEALITSDGRLIYRFDNHHAVMQAAKGIPAEQLPEVVCHKDRKRIVSLQ
jgi:hypothetical protein